MFFVCVKKNVNLHVPDKLHCGWWQAAFAGALGLWGGRSPPLSMSVPKWLYQGPLLDNHHSLLRRWQGRGAKQSVFASASALPAWQEECSFPSKSTFLSGPAFHQEPSCSRWVAGWSLLLSLHSLKFWTEQPSPMDRAPTVSGCPRFLCPSP